MKPTKLLITAAFGLLILGAQAGELIPATGTSAAARHNCTPIIPSPIGAQVAQGRKANAYQQFL